MKIYHFFPGKQHHHVVGLIRFFIDNHKKMGVSLEDQCFIVNDFQNQLKEEQVKQYETLGLKKHQLLFIKPTPCSVISFFRSIEKRASLILHSGIGYFPHIFVILYFMPNLRKKIVWTMWGSDINSLPERFRSNTAKSRILYHVISKVVRDLYGVSALVPGDYNIVQELFGPCDHYIRAFYSSMEINEEIKIRRNTDVVRVLLGNSRNRWNNHIEALEWLSRFKEESIEVIAPLSYGKMSDYVNEVIKIGKELLGDKFIPLMDMIPREDYKTYLDSIDILVFNHQRQAGLFNLYYMVSHGKLTYVRNDATPYKMMKDYGIETRDTLEIKNMTFDEFQKALTTQTSENNIRLFQENISISAASKCWKVLFKRLRDDL